MRLWHQDLLDKLPRQQILGQHRECAALRGNGWGKPHSTVNYVFEYDLEHLVAYHQLVINEMLRRGYNPNSKWQDYNYRGKNCEPFNCDEQMVGLILDLADKETIYLDHDDKYYWDCLANLSAKGIELNGKVVV